MATEIIKIQIDDEVREATPDEIAQIQAAAAESQALKAEIEAKAQARESALAKLKALGLSDSEIAALV